VNQISAASIALVCALTFPSVGRAELPASWMALPEETVVMLRVPSGVAFFDALRKQTKLGSLLLSDERVDRAIEAIKAASPEEWEAARQGLGRFDLKLEDLSATFRGETGVAVAMQPRTDREPFFAALAWIEPGEDLAGRLLNALQSVIAEQSDDEHAVERDDLELAGQKVIHLMIPWVSTPEHTLDLDGDDDDPPSEDELRRKLADFTNQQDAEQEETDRLHLLVSQMEGRLLLALTFPQSAAQVSRQKREGGGKIDWDKITGLEEAQSLFGQFLTAHAGSGSGRIETILGTPGVGETLPTGVPLFELTGDLGSLLRLADLDSSGKVSKVLDGLGVGSLGALATRTVLDGTILRSGFFLAAPAPRIGLLGLLDQPPVEPQPPAWVPASAVGYQAFSFDMGQAYDRIKELANTLGGPNAGQSFVQVETMAKGLLQVDLRALIGSLDHQISSVTFAPRISKVATPGDDDDDDQDAGPSITQRVGVVWPIHDEQPWNNLLNRLAQQVGTLKQVNEQGFTGYRFEQAALQAGIFIGHGFLVISIGPEVSEPLLAVLRAPPDANRSMLSSGLVERGRALLPPRPCFAYELVDGGSSVKVVRQLLEGIFELSINPASAVPSAPGAPPTLGLAQTPAQIELVQKFKALLPSDDELEGVMGVSVSQTVVTDQGLSSQSAVELPAP
jgi:hypothetical protein